MMAVWQEQRSSPPQRARHWSRPSARAGEGRTPRPAHWPALLRSELAPAYLVALGEVWEAAVAALSARPGRLARPAATRLLGSWLRLAANRADEWHRPRHQRENAGRAVVRPEADIAAVARWQQY